MQQVAEGKRTDDNEEGHTMNTNTKEIIKNTFNAAFGLFAFAFGVYLTIQANIGVAPWEAFNLGLSGTFGIKYGTASITVSLIIVVIDFFLKEKIGIGMLLDAILVGKFVDLFNFIKIVPLINNIFAGAAVMILGMFIMGFAQFLYMRAGLGCGPRDTLLVGLKRRSKKIPIGIISIFILATVTVIGKLLGGPIGIGTLMGAFLEGPIMQLDFRIVHFDPTEIKHQDIITSLKTVFKRKNK